MRPLRFVLDEPLTDRNGQYIIERHDMEYFKVSRRSPDDTRYNPEYLFSMKERSLSDFSGMCLYHQTSPESHFTQQKVCSIATATGRITLTDDRLIVTENGIRTESGIGDEREFERVLPLHFDIVL
jgi:N-hydroxyarylamine O-acetyltransferase